MPLIKIVRKYSLTLYLIEHFDIFRYIFFKTFDEVKNVYCKR